MRLRAADQPARQEDQNAANHYLKCRLKKWSVHIAMADVTDYAQFHGHYKNGYSHCYLKMGNQERQRVSQSTRGGHQSGYRTANPR